MVSKNMPLCPLHWPPPSSGPGSLEKAYTNAWEHAPGQGCPGEFFLPKPVWHLHTCQVKEASLSNPVRKDLFQEAVATTKLGYSTPLSGLVPHWFPMCPYACTRVGPALRTAWAFQESLRPPAASGDGPSHHLLNAELFFYQGWRSRPDPHPLLELRGLGMPLLLLFFFQGLLENSRGWHELPPTFINSTYCMPSLWWALCLQDSRYASRPGLNSGA